MEAADSAAFSLGPDGLPGIRFDESRRPEYENICDSLIQRALEEHHAFHTSAHTDHRWKLVRQRDALSVYRHRTPMPPLQPTPIPTHSNPSSSPSSSRSSLMMGSGFLPGTLNDTMLGVYCDTTETMRITKSILSDKFLDGAMVHVFEKNAIHAPIIFSGIKWFAMQCPGGTLTHDRDLLCYERMGRIVDHDGNYFAYHALQSIDLPEWPADHANLKRAYLSMCYLYRQVNDKWVGCFMIGDYDPASLIPQSITDFVVSDMMLCVGNVLECAQAKRFSMLMLQSVHTPPTTSRHCSICLSTAGLFTTSEKAMQRCVGCQKRVCKRCRLSCKVFRLSMRSRKPKKEWFCRECVGQVVVGPPRRNDWAEKENNDPSAHSSGGGASTSQSSPASNPDSVRSDQESKLHEMDMDALADLAQTWAIKDNNNNGLVWNAEELARLSGRLSTRLKRRGGGVVADGPPILMANRATVTSSKESGRYEHVKTAKDKEKEKKNKLQSAMAGLSRSLVGGGPGGSKSIFAAPFMTRASSREKDLYMAEEDEFHSHQQQQQQNERRDPNYVPGNSYSASGGNNDWRANAARLNASVTANKQQPAATTPSSTPPPLHRPFTPPHPPSSTSSSSHGGRSRPRKDSSTSSNASSTTSSQTSGSSHHHHHQQRPSRRAPPPPPPTPPPPPPSVHSAHSVHSVTGTSSSASAAAKKQHDDEEIKRLYLQFMATMARNRAEQAAAGGNGNGAGHGGDGRYGESYGESYPEPTSRPTTPGRRGGHGRGGNSGSAPVDPILQSKLVFDPERGEYIRVPIHGAPPGKVHSPRDKCFSIDELD